MMRGMFAAISGLRVHQVMLDVTANDIANVNTIGYKSERTTFKDALSQTQRGASGPSATLGGTNAAQIGLGVQLNGIDNLMQSGAIQSTGNALDVAIQGDGYFRVASFSGGAFGAKQYTRAGNFTRDTNGYLETPDGSYVVGYTLNAGAPTTTETRIQIPPNAKSVSIGSDGIVSIVDSTGTVTQIAAITLAKFPNDAGLERVSGNKFSASNNSGAELVGTPGDATGVGTLSPGSVEMSNVDLAQEFTNLITAQRGFQANSRIITSADEMLQELVNLKH